MPSEASAGEVFFYVRSVFFMSGHKKNTCPDVDLILKPRDLGFDLPAAKCFFVSGAKKCFFVSGHKNTFDRPDTKNTSARSRLGAAFREWKLNRFRRDCFFVSGRHRFGLDSR